MKLGMQISAAGLVISGGLLAVSSANTGDPKGLSSGGAPHEIVDFSVRVNNVPTLSKHEFSGGVLGFGRNDVVLSVVRQIDEKVLYISGNNPENLKVAKDMAEEKCGPTQVIIETETETGRPGQILERLDLSSSCLGVTTERRG